MLIIIITFNNVIVIIVINVQAKSSKAGSPLEEKLLPSFLWSVISNFGYTTETA